MNKLKIVLIFLIIVCSCSENKVENWQDIYEQDINAIHKIVKENHPGYIDIQNVGFKKNLMYFYEEALAAKVNVVDYISYNRYLKHFVNSFKDKHMLIRFPKGEEITIASGQIYPNYVDEKFIIRTAIGDDYPELNGWEIVKVDGFEVAEYFKKNILFYEGNEDIVSDWIYYAPKLLVHYDIVNSKRPKTITVERDGKTKEVKLAWTEISELKMLEIQKEMTSIVSSSFGMEQIENNIYWVSIPSFQLDENQRNHFLEIVEQLSDLQDIELLIIDLRGNNGGNSAYGEMLSNALYGEDFTKLTKNNLYQDVFVEYRTSASNAENIRKFSTEIADNMDKARKDNKAFYRYDFKSDTASNFLNPDEAIASQVIVITDVLCFSSCLDYMDLMLKHPNSVHVGLPTGADSQYIENTGEILPSNKAKLSYSMKVYRNRYRKPNQVYIPNFIYKQDIGNTDELRRWVLTHIRK